MSRPTNRLGHGASRGSQSTNSFHAGAPIPTLASMRRQTSKYQTFPTLPPKTPLEQSPEADAGSESDGSESGADEDEITPLPVRQLLLLAFLSLSEQTALNSIAPYLPQMVAEFSEIPQGQSGLYVGILASSFALAQLSTNFLWGYASDVIGRKPVLLLGTLSLMCCFAVFGFCKTYWQVVVVHVFMGLLNGNAACVPTVLGEVTDRSNQSRAFTYLPVIYSLGGITGPALGGVLVGTMGEEYPYLGPNVLGAAMLAVSFVVVGIWFDETLEDVEPPETWMPLWMDRLWSWIMAKRGKSADRPGLSRTNSWATRWPRSQASTGRPLLSSSSPDASDDEDEDEDEDEEIESENHSSKFETRDGTPWRELLNKTTLILLTTYLVFQLTNISFNSLYPIFAAAPTPAGRELDPERIGISLSLAGLFTIVFQAFLFQFLKARLGNLGSYRLALLGLAVAMVLMPWVGYLDDNPFFGLGTGKTWLYIELGFILILKNICAVGGLSSVMLLITNSAPSHASLGTLNGVAQTLSALGRSIGPFVSGGLFTLSTGIRPKGEALAWSLFGGLALLGWVGSIFIRRDGLESDDWQGAENEEEGAHEEA